METKFNTEEIKHIKPTKEEIDLVLLLLNQSSELVIDIYRTNYREKEVEMMLFYNGHTFLKIEGVWYKHKYRN
jgi:hypothetical protein